MLEALTVVPGTSANLAERDTRAVPDVDLRKDDADELVGERTARIELLQQRLYAENERAVLLVLQGMDTSGKDGAIKNVLRGITPAAFDVVGFKAPAGGELERDYLWRIHSQVPKRGRIGVFNRSHYEDVVAAHVRRGLARARVDTRYGHLNDFERLLTDEGTVVVKCFLHISKDEQKERLQARLDDPEKRWKFRIGDLDDRARWDDFMAAYERAIAATSTAHAPWIIVPADRKWLRDVVVAEALARALERMDPKLPPDDPALDDVTIT